MSRTKDFLITTKVILNLIKNNKIKQNMNLNKTFKKIATKYPAAKKTPFRGLETLPLRH